ncbi:MAG: hypothetical protein HC897_17035 [Thermoanaerobaculia bacterium]|nr:hypothetical protein [Thermoanaerobaculia bacterium]
MTRTQLPCRVLLFVLAISLARPIFAAEPAPPRWQGWTVYHVMMGFFDNGNRANDGEITGWRHPNYGGGDLQGVLQKADYLRDLGVTAVWLSPIFAAQTSHGYDVTNYYRIGDAVGVPGDPAASLALFRSVVAALHERGIAVVLDIPLNHASRAYDRKNGDPGKLGPRATSARQEAEKVWEGWGAPYRYWSFEHAPTRRFLKDVALYWLVEVGVDGLRLDYVRGVPRDFWAELRAEVAAAKPDAWLVGEVWIDAEGAETNAREIATYYAPVEGGGRPFDSLLDFPLQIVMTDVFARGGAVSELASWLDKTAQLYDPGAHPAYFLDNHDMTRFLSWTGDRDRLVAALGFMAALSSPMVVFYGTETAIANASPKVGFTDAGRIPIGGRRSTTDCAGGWPRCCAHVREPSPR